MKDVLGRNIRLYRDRVGLSQEALAARVGLSKSAIGLIEVGKSWPIHDNLVAIAEVLQTTDRELLATGNPVVLKPTPEEALEVIREALKNTQPAKAPEPAPAPLSPTLERVAALLENDQIRSVLMRHIGELEKNLPKRKAKASE
jgi:transcriptional regulator with XRE-family HTH domain